MPQPPDSARSIRAAMATVGRRFRRAAFLPAAVGGLLLLTSGCAVGLQYPDGPEAPPPAQVAPFPPVTIHLAACAQSEHTLPEAWVQRFAAVMERDYGVPVQLDAPPPGAPYVRVRLTLSRPRMSSGLAYASAGISTATLSIIPGYFAEIYPVEVAYALRPGPDGAGGADGAVAPRRLRYEYRYRYWLWLPFMVYPDFLASVFGGYENEVPKHMAWERVTRRFAADLRAALADPAAAPGEPYPDDLDAPCAEPRSGLEQRARG